MRFEKLDGGDIVVLKDDGARQHRKSNTRRCSCI